MTTDVTTENLAGRPADTTGVFGYHLRIEIGRADVDKVSRGHEVLSWAQAVVAEDGIRMKPYGEPWLEHFGPEPGKIGWTLFFPITTSNLMSMTWVHANDTGTGFFDVFSCDWFDPIKVVEMTKKFFNAQDITWDFKPRRIPPEGKVTTDRPATHN